MTGDLSDVTGLWPFLGLLVIVATPSLFAWLNSRQAKRESRTTNKTLTTNNGGSHVKDALDRIERGLEEVKTVQASQADRLGFLERSRARPSRRRPIP